MSGILSAPNMASTTLESCLSGVIYTVMRESLAPARSRGFELQLGLPSSPQPPRGSNNRSNDNNIWYKLLWGPDRPCSAMPAWRAGQIHFLESGAPGSNPSQRRPDWPAGEAGMAGRPLYYYVIRSKFFALVQIENRKLESSSLWERDQVGNRKA